MSSSASYELGKEAYARADYQRAVLLFSKAIEEHKSGEDRRSNELHVLYSNRCACYIQLHDNIGALGDAKLCVAHSPPTYIKGYARLGSCYYNLKMHKDALLAYERVLEIEPGHAEAVKMVSLLKRGIGDGSDGSGNSGSNRASSSNNNSNRFGGAGPPPATTTGGGGGAYNNMYNAALGGIGDVYTSIKNTVSRWITQVFSFFYFIHPDEKIYYYTGFMVVAMFIFMWISRSFFGGGGEVGSDAYTTDPNYAERIAVDPSHPDYIPPPPGRNTYHSGGSGSGYRGGSSGYSNSGSYFSYGGGGYGLSFSSILLFMVAGYFVPPLIPNIVGPERARPFLGMSWMTFLWLVRLIFDRGGGGFGGGGFMFGGNRRRRGGFF